MTREIEGGLDAVPAQRDRDVVAVDEEWEVKVSPDFDTVIAVGQVHDPRADRARSRRRAHIAAAPNPYAKNVSKDLEADKADAYDQHESKENAEDQRSVLAHGFDLLIPDRMVEAGEP